MATIKDVSISAGVSSATVSHVINNTRYVSDEVRERILNSIRELDYHPNIIARTLRMGKSNTIGVIVPNTRNPYFTELAWNIEQYAAKKNYSVMICNTENLAEKENFYIDLLIQKQVDGIVFISCSDYAESTEMLAGSDIPFVIVDKDIEDAMKYDTVLVEEEKGAQLAVEHLISLGHRRIACITGGSNEQITSEKRRNGYRKAMRKHKLPIPEEYVVEGDFLMTSGYVAGKKLFATAPRPTAVFAFNDLMAIGVLSAAHECGLNVPRDVSVIGYDDIELSSYCSPPLTTVNQNRSKAARNIFDTLFKMMTDTAAGNRRIKIIPKLVIRESTADCPDASQPVRKKTKEEEQS